jgi:GDP-L-fucose synthase
MTILVSGATGLAGSAIKAEFEKKVEKVIGISSQDINLLDRNATFEYINELKPRVVIDAAAIVGGIGANSNFPAEFLSKNIQIQTNLMDASHNAGVQKFLFLSSSCVYPRNCPQPIKEEYLLTGPLEQTNSAYAIAKISGMELIKSYRRQFAHKWISVMPTNLYGPNDNFDLESSHVFPALIRKFIEAKQSGAKSVNLWGSGKPKREFLHSNDLAKAIVVCLEKYDSEGPINIGSGMDISIADLAKQIANIVEFNGEITWDRDKPDGTPQKLLDIKKISDLGWKPSISLDEGITLTVDWYLKNK